MVVIVLADDSGAKPSQEQIDSERDRTRIELDASSHLDCSDRFLTGADARSRREHHTSCIRLDSNYRFRLTDSKSNSSVVVMTLELA